MIKLFFHTSPNPMKIALFLEEAGLPYELIGVDTFRGEQHSPEYRAVNPNSRTPAILDDGKRIFDSTAILLYLAEKEGVFLAPNERRGEMLSWLMFVATGIAPMGGQLVHFTRVHPDDYAANRYRRECQRLFGVLDQHLSTQPYLAGSSYTIADISAWGWIRIADFVMGEGALSNYPHLAAWFQTIDQRPAAARARAVADRTNFKKEFDEETMRAMFPQNYPAAESPYVPV